MEARVSVRPFCIQTPQPVLDRIHAQLAASRIGYAPDHNDAWHHGMSARALAELVGYWLDGYDWRLQEAALNRLPQFKAELDGIDLHFIHVRSDGPGSRPVPIILTHGWPGSILEFVDVIPRLVAAGFSVVVPCLPGYGWSGRPRQPIGPRRVAGLWRRLMTEVLGYPRFLAQGGDWGSVVTCQLGIDHQDVVAGIHLNFFMPPPPGVDADPALLDYWQAVGQVTQAEGGYQHEHATKPQTIGLALHDNPLGWAAWVVEKFWRWGDTTIDLDQRFSKDHLIGNLMTYLVTDTVISSIWMYYGLTQERLAPGPVRVPTSLATYPHEFYPMPSRALAERQHNVVRLTEMPRGGHFAALEQPEAFAADLIAAFGGAR